MLPLNDTIKKDIDNNHRIYYSNIICFRKIETAIETKSIVLIIDKEQSFVIEINDDKADNHDKAIGFATYSNSRATVLCFLIPSSLIISNPVILYSPKQVIE